MKTILIVEDTHAERQMSSALLTHAGFDVAVSENAETAWRWLNEHPAPDWKNIPILFCSSKAEEFDRFWAIRQGGNEYITKPYVPQNLVDKVRQFAS